MVHDLFTVLQTMSGYMAGLWRYSEMSYAVYQYFQNGGRDALIVRVHNGDLETTTSTFNIIGDTFKIKASQPRSME